MGALKREKRTFIVALLACGWPNNRSYKWEDTKKLMEYGLEHFEYQSVKAPGEKFKIRVTDGIPDSNQKRRIHMQKHCQSSQIFVSAGRLGICSGKKEHSDSIAGSVSGKGQKWERSNIG